MNLQFPLLTPEQIEVKVKRVSEKGAILLCYKTARVDMDMLDQVVGPMNWQCRYEEIKGNLYCGIGIRNPETGEVVWKSDCGIESREDDEGNQKKGEASDAFKRAGFRWGIGRELYSCPFTFASVETTNRNNKWYLKDTFASFSVSEISYDDNRRVNALAVVDNHGNEVFRFPKGRGTAKPQSEPVPVRPAPDRISPEQIAAIKMATTPEQLSLLLGKYNLTQLSDMTGTLATRLIESLKKRKESGK